MRRWRRDDHEDGERTGPVVGDPVRGARGRHDRLPGLRLVDLAESELCCGSAGIYNLLEPEMADRLLDRKLDRIVETGARVVVTGNPGCMLQIARGARARGLDLDVVHPVELLARAVEAREARGVKP